jgi:hypothetical protein
MMMVLTLSHHSGTHTEIYADVMMEGGAEWGTEGTWVTVVKTEGEHEAVHYMHSTLNVLDVSQ